MIVRPVWFLLPLLSFPSVACRGQSDNLVVNTLTTPRPAVQGRFATVICTVRDVGTRPVPLKAVAITLVGGDGHTTDFTVSPPNPPLSGGLRPDQAYTFRQFQQMNTVGDFVCTVRAQDAQGKWRRLPFANGRPATATLHVVPPDAVPRVLFGVTDPHPDHIYRPGQRIALQVTPILTGGPNLSSHVASVQISTPAKPWVMSDPTTARDLLHGGAFTADFFRVPDAQKYLDITVSFAQPARVTSWSLTGENLNDQYGLKDCVAEAVTPDGAIKPFPVIRTQDGDRWTVLSAEAGGMSLSGLRLRVSTDYKINLTGLSLRGGAQGRGAVVTAQWQDASGQPLAKPVPLTLFRPNAVTLAQPLAPGYAGLVLTTRIPGVDPTRQEYGFAVLPPPPGAPSHDARLGMVHPDIHDPNLGAGWIKTLGTNFFDEPTFTLDAAGWQKAIAERRANGLSELPLMSDQDWVSDSTTPVSAEQIRRLHDKMVQYFRATPDVHYWELGLEENLAYRAHRRAWVDYWPNLEAKARAVRGAAADAHADVKFIYQIAETDPQTVEEFCRSAAQRQFDVLSLHPYAWPDFPPPERWMPPYLAQVRSAMARFHAEKPIWYTEIGAPVNGNPGGFFGYPSVPAFDRGLTRAEHASYLVRCHLMALRLGVGKIFWYTHRDGGNNPEYAEDFFGMVDFRGHPEPSYPAYCTMTRLLGGKPFQSAEVVGKDIQVSRFGDGREDCTMAWTYPAAPKTVTLSALNIPSGRGAQVLDLLGKPVPMHNGNLVLSGDPVYILSRR